MECLVLSSCSSLHCAGRYISDQDTEFCRYNAFCTGPDARFSSKTTCRYRRVRTAQGRGMEFPPHIATTVRGITVERRSAKRDQILVDIDIAHPGAEYCHGHVENISKCGVSVIIREGKLPDGQRSVILNLRVWTGNEMLYRKVYCRVIRHEENRIAMSFAENDIVTEAIIDDLMFYQKRGRKHDARKPEQKQAAAFTAAALEPMRS